MNLKEQVLTGLKWSVISKLIVQSFSWISTFLIIRILTPDDYGLVAIVTVLFSFITIFTVNGFVTTLVKNQKMERKTFSQLFTVSFIIYVLFSLLFIISADSIASFYDEPKLESIIFMMAVVTPLNSFCIVPNAIFNIRMDFKKKAICESITAVATTFVALIAVYSEYGYWSLIYASIAGIVTNVICLNLAQKKEYNFTADLSGAKSLLSFAGKIQFNEFIWFIYNKLDVMIIGKFLGIQRLGIYNVAIEIAALPMSKVASILNQVGLSAFSSINDDLDSAKSYLTKTLRLIAIISFPIFTGISIVSHEIVSILIGEKWADSGPIIAIFALIFPFRMLNAVIGNFTIAMGEAKFTINTTLIISICVISAIIIGVQFSLIATAIAWCFGFLTAFIITLVRVFYKYRMTSGSLTSWLSPLLVSMFMWLFLWQLDLFFRDDLLIIELLLMKVIVGITFISLAYYFLFKEEVFNILKSN